MTARNRLHPREVSSEAERLRYMQGVGGSSPSLPTVGGQPADIHQGVSQRLDDSLRTREAVGSSPTILTQG
jgi:hypothetical protein